MKVFSEIRLQFYHFLLISYLKLSHTWDLTYNLCFCLVFLTVLLFLIFNALENCMVAGFDKEKGCWTLLLHKLPSLSIDIDNHHAQPCFIWILNEQSALSWSEGATKAWRLYHHLVHRHWSPQSPSPHLSPDVG